jgi:radical SAM superfamily enzyme YgiQ (UPF0313 family)
MKVLFVSPAIYDWRSNLIKQKRVWLPGLTLPYLAALFPSNYEITIVDETSEEIQFEENWDLVCISSIGASYIRAAEIARLFKVKNIPVIVGGMAATLTGTNGFDNDFNSFTEGEVETIINTIISDFENGKLKKHYKGEQTNLSSFSLPIPRYELFNKKKIGFWLPVQTSRGCVYKCPYCSVAAFNQFKFRQMPIDYVVACIKRGKELGYSNFTFIDDSIASDINHLKKLCEAIIPLKIYWMTQCTITIAEHPEILKLMAQSGCTVLSLGIESTNPESIASIGKTFNNTVNYKKYFKIIRSYGIDISTEMMIGLDGDTENIYNEFTQFAIENNITLPRFYIATPVPGTKFYSDLVAENRIFNFDYLNYTGSQLVFYPKNLDYKTLEDKYWTMYDKVYSTKNILRRYILSRPKRSLFSNIFTLAANFHYKNHIKHRIPPGIV